MSKKNHTYKYHYLPNGDTIAISHFAGKTVKGIAHCDMSDTYNQETGEQIAAAKCNEKIAKLRTKRAIKCLDEAWEQFAIAKRNVENMQEYLDRSIAEWDDAQNELMELILATGWKPRD